MIRRFLRFIFLGDILQTLFWGIKIALTKKPVTIKFPKQTVTRPQHIRKVFSLDHNKCIQCKICEAVCPCRSIIILNAAEHDFKKFQCAYCGLCAKACPKGAIKFSRDNNNETE